MNTYCSLTKTLCSVINSHTSTKAVFHSPISCCHFNSSIDTLLTFKIFYDWTIVGISNLGSRSTTLSKCLQDFADTVPSVQDWLLQSGNSDQIVIFWRLSWHSTIQKNNKNWTLTLPAMDRKDWSAFAKSSLRDDNVCWIVFSFLHNSLHDTESNVKCCKVRCKFDY